MNKFLALLALIMVVCLACVSFAFAEDQDHDFHVHSFTLSADESKVVTWPYYDAANKQLVDGLIRFYCDNAGEYQTEAEAAVDFKEYVIHAVDHVLPKTWQEAVALLGTDRVVEGSYVAPVCETETPGKITIKCGHVHVLDKSNVDWFTGFDGTCDVTKEYEIPAVHQWSNLLDPPQYLHLKEPTCTEKGLYQVYCTVCGETKEEYIYPDELPHEPEVDENGNEVWTVTKPATCREDGEERLYCKYGCGTELADPRVILANENAHVFGDWLVQNEKLPTCTEDGEREEYRLCKVCLEAKEIRTLTAKEDETLKALGHDVENKVEIDRKEPTCSEEGYIKYECPRCHNKLLAAGEADKEPWTETLAVDPDAHPEEYVKLKNTVPATCEDDGTNTYECNACGKTWDETLPKLGHIWMLNSTTPGKCANNGKLVYREEESVNVPTAYNYVCTRDNTHTKTEYAETAPEHDWTEWTLRNAYNEGGKDTPAYWIRQCKVCGQHDERVLNSAQNLNYDCTKEGHLWDVTEEVPATCAKTGYKVEKCANCGETQTTEIAKVPHTAGEVVIENEIPATCKAPAQCQEVIYCTECGAEMSRVTKDGEEFAEHTPGTPVMENIVPATCVEPRTFDEVVYCTVCDEELSRETKQTNEYADHTPGEAVKENEKEATCESLASYDEVVYCTVCGEELSRETKEEGELADHVAGEAVTENEVAATCAEAGSHDEVVYCTVCGEELSRETVEDTELANHTYELTEEVEATATEPGKKVYTCTVCGDTYEEEVAFVPTEDPAYNLNNVDYDGEYITGNVDHVVGTKDSDVQYIRATYFFANGTTSIVVSQVYDDGTFDIGLTGDVVHVTLVVTGTGKCVRPDGSWLSMGVYEF